MARRTMTGKAVVKVHVAEPRRSGRATSRSANVAEHSDLAMLIPQPEESSRARTPRRPAARGKWSEEQLMTSDKSLLIDIDLVRLLAQPEAWNCLDESEKREILALLPPDAHPDAQAIPEDSDEKIEPIPDSFIRYSNNWRDGVRQFQLDLQNGRYDPEWLHQAEEARQQRENGDFDNFKEREYEQFWGQKQKVVWDAPAGESARVKMKTLIDEGVIRLGDIWKFYYVYGKGLNRIVIEKETRINEINGAKLTFAVPPGERVFLRSGFDKAEQPSQSQMTMEDTTTDLSTKSQPVTLASNGDDVRDDVDTEPHILPATPDSKGTKAENPGSQVTIASPSNEESQPSQDFSVVVVSPDTRRNQRSKRTMPEPKPQPPVKRRRGRPPKNQPKQPKGEAVKEPEISAKQATSQEVEVAQSDMPGLSVMSILEAKIAESYNDSPEHPHQETDFSKPSPPLKSLVSGSSTSVEEEEVSTANTNHKDQVASAMAVDSSTVHPDAAPDSVNAPVKADQNDPDPTLAEGLQQITPNATQTTNETDDIIIQNIASPRALVSKILQIDGRMPNSRTSNAWKEIRCYRNNQDMGSLFDVREAWFLQHRKDD